MTAEIMPLTRRGTVLLKTVLFLLIFAVITRPPIDADMWWHLRAGQVMWDEKTILLTDSFSYTMAGAPWVNAFWLSDILLFLVYQAGGYTALAGFVSLVGTYTFHLTSKRLKGNQVVNGGVILLAVLTAAPILGPRPHILSFLLVAFLDSWLEEKPTRSLWVLVPLFMLWANIHGGWIWGILLLLAHLAGTILELLINPAAPKRRNALSEIFKFAIWTLLAGISIGVNPNGFLIWKLPFQQVEVSMQIQEWLSPNFHLIEFHPMVWMIFLLIITARYSENPPSWPRLIKVLGFAYLTFVAQRNIALFAIMAVPLLAEGSNDFLRRVLRKRPLHEGNEIPRRISGPLNSLIILLIGMVTAGRLFTAGRATIVDQAYPTGAVKWLKSNPVEGRLFNSYNWGGYIIWNLHEIPVFIDGRADLYGPDLISQWLEVVRGGEKYQMVLDEWKIETIFLESGWPVIPGLIRNGWTVVYQDDVSVILTH